MQLSSKFSKQSIVRRPRLNCEKLEDRDVPAGTVITAMSMGSLFILGDTNDNQITITQAGPNTLAITPTGGTTVDGSSTTVLRPIFSSLVIRLGTGNDSVTFDLSTPMLIRGNLTIDYGTTGTGDKTTMTSGATSSLTVLGSLAIRYAGGNVATTLDNVAIAGNLVVRHGLGDSTFQLDNLLGSGHFSSVGGSLVVSNTRGMSVNQVNDTNVAGSILCSNHQARVADNAAGSNQIFNVTNTTPATIGGSILIVNSNGDSPIGDVIADVNVKGGVGLNLGTGNFNATVSARNASTGPTINGGLGVRGSGAWTGSVALGAPASGLTVKGNLSLGLGNGSATISIDDVHVLMGTSILTGRGNDQLNIDGNGSDVGSVFAGGFVAATGPGQDSVTIGGGAASALTEFKRGVAVNLGTDDDSLQLATVGKVKFDGLALSVVSFNGGLGTNTKTVDATHLIGRTPLFKNFS